MCGTPGMRRGSQITHSQSNSRHTYQIFPTHLVSQLMLVESPATNRERERNTTEPDIMVDHTQKSASRDSPHRRESLKNIIAQICQSRSQNAWEIGVDQ